MSIRSYRSKILALSKEIARLQDQKSKEFSKIADRTKRLNNAMRTASTSRSESVIRSKFRDSERYREETANAQKKVAEFEKKIAKKQDELHRAQQSLEKEEEREYKKHQQEENKLLKQRENQIRQFNRKLGDHDRLHRETQSTLKKLQELPNEIVVLFFAANPIDQDHLRLDEEVRSIEEMIRKSEYRDSVKFVTKWAVRPADILQALNEHNPCVVHFSGHGSNQDEIVFQDDQGTTKPVKLEAIAQLMMAVTGSIRLVFFNTCYSLNQAEAVVEHVEAAIGMTTTISDDTARIFASQFYSAIGFGKSLAQSFEQAKALVMLEDFPEEEIPELFTNINLSAEKIILVQPRK